MSMIPFPIFSEFKSAVKNMEPIASLLWMAIAKLSTRGGYSHLTPHEVYEDILRTANEVYV